MEQITFESSVLDTCNSDSNFFGKTLVMDCKSGPEINYRVLLQSVPLVLISDPSYTSCSVYKR